MTKDEALKQALAAMRDLCDAADDVGVAHFDSDDMSAEAERMARTTVRAREVLNAAESAIAASGIKRRLITLEEAVRAAVKQYGSIRATERATGIDKSFISRLLRGEKVDPNAKTLEALGLSPIPFYEVLKTVNKSRAIKEKP